MFTGETYWKDTATGIQFRRIVHAMSWPFDTLPGCVCVLGEVLAEDPKYHAHKVILLHDEEQKNVNELLRHAHAVGADTGIMDVVGRRDVPEMRLMEIFNRDMSARRERQLRMMTPPEADERERFRFWLRLLERRTVEEKTMIFGDSQCVRARLMSTPKSNYDRIPEEFPTIAAVLYALAEIDLHQKLPTWKHSSAPVDALAGY